MDRPGAFGRARVSGRPELLHGRHRPSVRHRLLEIYQRGHAGGRAPSAQLARASFGPPERKRLKTLGKLATPRLPQAMSWVPCSHCSIADCSRFGALDEVGDPRADLGPQRTWQVVTHAVAHHK